MRHSDELQGLILASASPRRQQMFLELFGQVGFSVVIPDFDESGITAKGRPHSYVKQMAQAKCSALLHQYPKGTYLAVTADTVVVLRGKIFEKPTDENEARRMLQRLSGKRHRVLTAVTVAVHTEQQIRIRTDVVRSSVVFKQLSGDMVDWYVQTGESLDKAGAYGIQGRGSLLVSHIHGGFDNIVGLPIHRMLQLIEKTIGSDPVDELISIQLPWNRKTEKERENGNNPKDHGHASDTTAV